VLNVIASVLIDAFWHAPGPTEMSGWSDWGTVAWTLLGIGTLCLMLVAMWVIAPPREM